MKQVPQNVDARDVRSDPLGGMNKLINWVFTGKKPSIFRKLVGLVLHIELPALQNPVRIAHPFGITINPGVRIGKNVTLFQCVTIGSKRHGRNAGVPIIEDNVVLYPNAVVVGGGSCRSRGNDRTWRRRRNRHSCWLDGSRQSCTCTPAVQ